MVQHKKYIVWAGVFGLLVALHPEFLISTAHAQAGVDTSLGAVGKTFAQVMSFLVMGLHSLALIALGLVEFFLRPEFLNNEGMMGPDGSLKQIWLFSRDIVNFMFALMLIGVAFYTIIAGNSTKIKEYIKHFVLAVILVNFSWFFPRVILDISNVLTSTVFSLPSMVLSGASATCMTKDENGAPTPCVVLTEVRILPKDPVSICATNTATCKCFAPIVCYKFEDFNSSTTGNSHAILGALAINFGKIATIITVPQSDLGGGVGNGVQVQFVYILNVLFSLIFIIAMAFPLLALAVGLLMRILILWVCIAFMPFTFIGYVLSKGDLGGNIPGLGDQANIWKQFLVAAFLPLLVAIPITVGFIMIMAGMAGMGGVLPPINIKSDVPLISGVTDFFQFLWAFFAIAIIWIGAFAALRKSAIIGKVTDKIQNYGQSIGSAALKAPLMIPLPVPGGSIAGMAQGPGKMASAINAGFKDGKTLADALNDRKYGGRAPDSDVKTVADKLGNNSIQIENIAKSLRQGQIKDARASVKSLVGKDVNVDHLDDQKLIDLLERTNKFKSDDIAEAKRLSGVTPPPGAPPPTTPPPGTPPPRPGVPPVVPNVATDIKIVTNSANDTVIEITNPETKAQTELKAKDIKTKDDVINIYNSLNIPAGMENDPNVRRAAADAYRKVSTELDTRAGKTAAEIELSGKTKLIADALANPANDTDDAKSIIQNSFGNDIT